MYYVYLYLREDKTPYYVGKGSGKRINQQHKFGGGKLLPLPPLDRRVIVKYFDSEEKCFLFEEWLIEIYGRKLDGGILNNLCKGGGGYTRGKNFDRQKYNEKNKDRIRESQKEYREKNKEILSQKQKEKYRKRKEKQDKYWYGDISKENYNEKQRERYANKKENGYNRYEQAKEYQKQYREENKEKQKEYMREYYIQKKNSML